MEYGISRQIWICGTTDHEGQDLLCPIQYAQPWALRCKRCSGQVVSLMQNPQC
ncbi:hypothetical protein TNCV_3115521 [Trichonephila clavipes]|nr:hypothetical protein TNCV_3115521 [Trichonephila clavipes]